MTRWLVSALLVATFASPVTLPATIHNDTWDGATEAQKAEMVRYIDTFLRERN